MIPEFFGYCTRGKRHIESGIPCEDAYLIENTNGSVSFAVADGHGDTNCPRSGKGAEIACRIACDELIAFADKYSSMEALEEQEIQTAAMRIAVEWKRAVKEDLKGHPLTEQEKAGCDRYMPYYQEGMYLEHIYGSTVIAGLLTEDYLILLQQGDGRCSVYTEDGTVTFPVPGDDRCIANVTTSLCDDDAGESFRWHLSDIRMHPPMAVILSSDGLEDSFGYTEEVNGYEISFLEYLLKDEGEEPEQTPEEALNELSANGSRDDITICGFYNQELFPDIIGRLKKENEKQSILLKIDLIEERLFSMEGKMEFLKVQYEKACQEYILREGRNFEKRKKNALNSLEEYKKQRNQLLETKERLQEQLKSNTGEKENAEYPS